MTYTQSLEKIAADNLHRFFVGWPNPPSPETHRRLLENSDHIVLAVDEETGNVVGFITADKRGNAPLPRSSFAFRAQSHQRRGVLAEEAPTVGYRGGLLERYGGPSGSCVARLTTVRWSMLELLGYPVPPEPQRAAPRRRPPAVRPRELAMAA